MPDDKKSPSGSLPLHQAAEDPAAKILREKIGDTRTLTSAPAPAPHVATSAADQKELEEKIIATLQTVFDPEIPLNIYDLGLIYRLAIDPTNAVKVDMTLTAPGCPVAGDIVAEVKRKLEAIPEVPRAVIELVWDPPWTRDRLSEAARLELGM
ncbi:MAG TPA: iron-sulfur cluster assembly protein [Phycisphaerae bacterium]|jgi:FeS assembly SUF system protein|nr:iron-sulfur cluster assembly protein [Phycisphaerae bacterium]